MCELDPRQIPHACLGEAEVLGLDGGHFQEERLNGLNSDEGGARPEHNLGKIMCLLTKSHSIT